MSGASACGELLSADDRARPGRARRAHVGDGAGRAAAPGKLPATAFKWAYAAACDEPVPGDVAARLGGVAAWGTWSLSASDPKAIEFTIRANRAITGFGIVVPGGSQTRHVPPAGFTCPHAGIDFLECEGALAAGTQSGEGRIGLTPLPRKTATGSLHVMTKTAVYGPYRLGYAG